MICFGEWIKSSLYHTTKHKVQQYDYGHDNEVNLLWYKKYRFGHI